MLHGKREAEWNHTASLILVMQRVAGSKNAKFNNPYSAQGDDRQKLKDYFEKQKKSKKNE